MKTIDERLSGPTAGFDWVRLFLALWVIALHSVALSTGQGGNLREHFGWYRVLSSVAVPGFFAVSGFLVARSADRHTPAVYAAYRVLRLLPALGTFSLLTLFVFGPLVTSLSPADYFSRPQTWAQIFGLVGFAPTVLPGFQGKELLDFNGSLWSIPWEIGCYVGLGGIALAGGLRKPWVVRAGVLTIVGVCILVHAVGPVRGYRLWGSDLIACFASGVAFYIWRKEVVSSRLLGVAALALAVALFWFGQPAFAFVPLTYGLISVGLGSAPRLRDDLSYGIYICAFPVQNVLTLTPWGAVWWLNALLTLPPVVAYAWLSWRLVEQPALALKPKVATLVKDRQRLVRVAPQGRPTTDQHPATSGQGADQS